MSDHLFWRLSFFSLLVTCSVASGALAGAQASSRPAIPSRVIEPISEASLIPLQGNVHPLAQPRFDLGPAPASMPAERLMLILKRSRQQEADLESYLQSVQDPKSADFRKFLSPWEFGQRFGLPDADIDKIEKWLQSHGLETASVNKGRSAIEFSGTVGQLQEAFHTSIHGFLISGVQHWANASDPQIPAALAPVVAGISRLNDFKPRPNLIMGPSGKWNPETHQFAPDLTVSISGQPYLFVGPGDAATIYNTPNSFNTHFATNQTAYDGTGVQIGIAGTTLLYDGGQFSYRNLFNLPMTGTTTTVYDGNLSNMSQGSGETEALLDVEVSGGLAPGANVIYYGAGDTAFQSGLFLAIYRAIDDNKVSILSVSYGECEASLGAAGNLQVLNAWEQAAAQGITVTVSTGDSGAAGCDNPNSETVATHGLGVNGLASTPYSIAVGGTDFDILSKSFSTYVGSTYSTNFTSALSYIPENPWNDSTSANGMLAANTLYRNGAGQTNIVAGGGGVSSMGDAGQAGYSKPSWQQGFPQSNTDAVRDLPDVSLLAGNGQYGALWALCEGSDCSSGSRSTIHGVGGTSGSAPAFAGILALVNQKVGASTRLGQANWVLYKLAQSNPSVFHQVVTGNISVYCSSGSPNCGTNGFLTGYNAGPGYNLATGLGSVDATNLLNDWGNASLTATSTTLSLDKTSFAHGTPVNVTAGVNPSAATGSVAIENNYASQAQATGSSATGTRLSLSAGSASASYSQLPGGTYNVYANYGGDGTYAGSISQPVQVKVTPEDSVLQLSADTINSNYQLVSIAGQVVPLGSLISFNAKPIGVSQTGSPNPVTNATGNVQFDDSVTGGLVTGTGNTTLDATGNAEANISYVPAGPHSVSAIYFGDLSYNPSNAGTIGFTVSKAPTTIALTSASSVFSRDVTLTAQIATVIPVINLSAHGSVTFTDTTRNAVLGTTNDASFSQCNGVKTLCISAPLDVAPTQLQMGDNAIVATYTGDSNFIGSGPSAPTNVTCTAGCWNEMGQTLYLSFGQMSGGIITPGGTITAVVSTYSPTGFTGAVNLTCAVTGKNPGDQKIPACSFNPTQVNIANNLSGDTTLTIKSTAATTAALRLPSANPWYAAGETVLATVLLLGIPARRFRRRHLLALLTLLLSLGWISACGGGGSGSGGTSGGTGGGSTTPGTTADTYTVTFRAADAATGTVTAENLFNFTVN